MKGIKMKSGFYPALGTPLDEQGNLVKKSMQDQIERMIDAGASGLLVMGSMGQQAYIKDSQCQPIAKAAIEANKGRLPLFIGAMDNSAARVKQRITALEDLEFDGVVLTTPYYNVFSPDDTCHFFEQAAKGTKHSLFLYDLAGVTKIKITYEMVLQMISSIPNLKGIKSGDLLLQRNLYRSSSVPESFVQLFSSLDLFDVAYGYGINKNLDGMFSCTPVNSHKMYKALEAGDYDAAAEYLANIISLRNVFLKSNVLMAFTVSMNLHGFDGCFGVDFCAPVDESAKEEIKAEMVRIGEL